MASAVSLLGPEPARAERRVAMVVGINDYPALGIDAQLQRAVADADAVSRSLKQLGFSVTTLSHGSPVTQDFFLKQMAAFTRDIQPGDVVVFYFAGHGVGLSGANYLAPSDMPNLADADEYMFRAHALSEADIRARLQSRDPSVVLLMLDACRNNPFRSNERGLPLSRGLQPVSPSNGVMTIYAAAYGQTALDRLSDTDDPNPNSVFTRVVVEELSKPGVNLVDFSEDVREKVATIARSAGHDQVPAVDNQLLGGRSVYLAGPAVPPPPQALPDPKSDDSAWSFVRDSLDIPTLRRFLERYPDSERRSEVQDRLASLEAQSSASSAPPTVATRLSEGSPSDQAAWDAVSASSFPAELRDFIDKHPGSTFRSQAEQRLSRLDNDLWDSSTEHDLVAQQHYLALFPQGNHVKQAQFLVERLQGDDTAKTVSDESPPQTSSETEISPSSIDGSAWAQIASSNFSAEIRQFIERFPQSPLRVKAEQRLAELDNDLWIQTGDSDLEGQRHYLALFPEGIHASQARALIESLDQSVTRVEPSGSGLATDKDATTHVSENREMLSVTIGGREVSLETIVVRPSGPGPFPIALITHGVPVDHSKISDMTVDQLSMQARDFAYRGWLAVGVIRRGFGRSEGPFVEGSNTCDTRDYTKQLNIASEDILAALKEISRWTDVDPSHVLAVGVSVGGAVMLNVAAHQPSGLVGVINVSGSHGGNGNNTVCNEKGLVQAFHDMGRLSKVPTLWLYASNDHFFSTYLVHRMYEAFTQAGGLARLPELGSVGANGHELWSDWQGRRKWLPEVDSFLRSKDLRTWDVAPVESLVTRLHSNQLRILDEYIASGSEKALAISSLGSLGYSSSFGSTEDARSRAISECENTGHGACSILMQNFDVVTK